MDGQALFQPRRLTDRRSQGGEEIAPKGESQSPAHSMKALPIKLGRSDGISDQAVRRQRLGDFLITHRAAISPESAGLPRIGRRRTPGLRREEVATLAGVGVTWYTWLEQGRDIQASADTLHRIANVLRLTTAEKCHLFDLAALPYHDTTPSTQAPNTEIQSILDGFRDGPAFIVGPFNDIEGYNLIADAIFQFTAVAGPFASNQIWRFFMDPSRRHLYSDWDAFAPIFVGMLRLISGKYLGTPYLERMIQDMLDGSKCFQRLWSAQNAMDPSAGPIHFNVPDIGEMRFVAARFRPVSAKDWMLVLLSPLDDRTRTRVMALTSRYCEPKPDRPAGRVDG